MYPRKPGVLLQKVSLALCSFHKSKAMQMRFTPNKKIRVPLPKDGIHGRAETVFSERRTPAGAVAGIIPVGLLDIEHQLAAALLFGTLPHLGGEVLAVEQLHLVAEFFFVVKGI